MMALELIYSNSLRANLLLLDIEKLLKLCANKS